MFSNVLENIRNVFKIFLFWLLNNSFYCSISDDEPDAYAAEINDPDPPPASCEEENPYDRDR